MCAMETLIVVETRDGWCVERQGEIVFRAPEEDRCFQYALEASSSLFEQGVPNEVVLKRVS
jgi:hypothetical protein